MKLFIFRMCFLIGSDWFLFTSPPTWTHLKLVCLHFRPHPFPPALWALMCEHSRCLISSTVLLTYIALPQQYQCYLFWPMVCHRSRLRSQWLDIHLVLAAHSCVHNMWRIILKNSLNNLPWTTSWTLKNWLDYGGLLVHLDLRMN